MYMDTHTDTWVINVMLLRFVEICQIMENMSLYVQFRLRFQ
jgi:hypothetical protein